MLINKANQEINYNNLKNKKNLKLLKKVEQIIINNKSSILISLLLFGKIKTKPQSKLEFYTHLSSLLKHRYKNSKDNIKIERRPFQWENKGEEFIYIFKKDTNISYELNIVVQVFKNKLKLDTFPF